MPPHGAGHAATLSPRKHSRFFLPFFPPLTLWCVFFPPSHTPGKQTRNALTIHSHDSKPQNTKIKNVAETSQMSDQTETSVALNPITLIDHRKSILKVDEQSLLPNYRAGPIIIEVGCGCHRGSNEIILSSQRSDCDHVRNTVGFLVFFFF